MNNRWKRLLSGLLGAALMVTMAVPTFAVDVVSKKTFFNEEGNEGSTITVDHYVSEKEVSLSSYLFNEKKVRVVQTTAPTTVVFDNRSYQPTCEVGRFEDYGALTLLGDASPYATITHNGYRIYNQEQNKWVDVEELPAVYSDDYYYQEGYSMTFTQDGTYVVWNSIRGTNKRNLLVIQVGDGVLKVPEEVNKEATRSTATVVVDGKQVRMDAYNIEDNNYFKLRDLAYVLNGTTKQFSVAWDAAKDSISLTSGQSYVPAGGELVIGAGANQEVATKMYSTLYVDGKKVDFMAYSINDNNYFKLRDICQLFDVGLVWDSANNQIQIDTTRGYAE